MKISCLVLTVISGALMLAASDARASNPAPPQSEATANTGSVHPTVPTGQRRVQQGNAKANHAPIPLVQRKRIG